MVKLGNFLFHYRNVLFPVFYILLFIPSPVIFKDYILAAIIGLVIAFSGQIIRVITIGLVYIIRGGKDRQIYAEGLVTTGIFSHCRNPLYVGNILVILGLGFIANSMIFVLILVPLFIFFYQAIVLAEENFLQNKFGNEFTEYKKRVSRWFPNLDGLSSTLNSMEFRWKRVFVKEYNSTYVWMTAAALLIMKNFYVENGKEAFMATLPAFLLVIAALLILYVIVRYLKKSGKWKGD